MNRYLSPYKEMGLDASKTVGTKRISKRELREKSKLGAIQQVPNLYGNFYYEGNSIYTEMMKTPPRKFSRKVNDTTFLL